MTGQAGDALFDPRTVAVVGASGDPAKWGYWLAKGALSGASRRPVHLVNARGADVLGHPTHRTLRDLPETPDLVAIATPPGTYEQVVDDALHTGARHLVAITAGVVYPGGLPALAERVRSAGARLVGPTSMGVYDSASALALTWGTLTPGPIGVVSQSGSVGLEIGYLAAREGLGLSRFVSVGAAADLGVRELAEAVVAAPHTRAVILYLEDLSLGRDLIALAGDKPVVLLTVGGSAAGRRAVTSHTGALATPDAVVDALCRAAGAIRARTPQEAVHIAQACLAVPAPIRRVAVVADSGGQGAIAAELAERLGLEVPALTPATVEALAELLPPEAGLSNPVDLAGAGESDLSTYPRVVDLVASEVDAVVLTGYFASYAADSPSLGPAELAAAARLTETTTTTPCLIHTMRPEGPTVEFLRAAGIPVHGTVDALMAGLSAVTPRRFGDGPRQAGSPSPSTEISGHGAVGVGQLREQSSTAGARAHARRAQIIAQGEISGFIALRQALMAHGVGFPEGRLYEGADPGLAYPVVLKVLGPAHKTELGGVVLGIGSPADLHREAALMRDRLGLPLWVEEQLTTSGAELIVGAHRDPHAGPVVTFGAGGVLAELIADSVTALAPLTHRQAREVIAATRVSRLLDGWRGSAPADIDAVAHALVVVGDILHAHPELTGIEINPLKDGVALDAYAS
ncbi:acetate--CoA ligase family protein [Herbidospora cretacea]|uniref:acetate--CoA ligase family protein n=1 Tax=Herbidospora cretacea TaxID=28444 RepID=UPI000774B93E|nr:acetate--CoA ligase family protein [Herbidospora cretacea]